MTFTADHRRLSRLRLVAQGITARDEGRPADVASAARAMLATQAQDHHGTLWALGLRTASATRDDVEAAYRSGTIVRSWPQRGTLHVVAADDLDWMLRLTGERMIRAAAGRHRRLGLEEADFRRAAAIARDQLSGGQQLSRTELLGVIAANGVVIAGQRGAHLLVRLAQERLLVVCGQHSWALLEEWVPAPRRLEPAAALAEHALRYFTSHGPATAADYAWWSSLTLTQARAGAAAVRDQLDEIEVGGTRYLLRPGLAGADPDVHLLPGFDEYLLGYRDRRAPLADRPLEVVVPGGNGMFLSTVVVGGEVRATWRRVGSGAAARIELHELDALSPTARRRLARAVRDYAAFLGSGVSLAG